MVLGQAVRRVDGPGREARAPVQQGSAVVGQFQKPIPALAREQDADPARRRLTVLDQIGGQLRDGHQGLILARLRQPGATQPQGDLAPRFCKPDYMGWKLFSIASN